MTSTPYSHFKDPEYTNKQMLLGFFRKFNRWTQEVSFSHSQCMCTGGFKFPYHTCYVTGPRLAPCQS